MAKFKAGGHNTLCKCRVCGKLTHSTIDGNLDLRLCAKCTELAYLENDHNDGAHADEPHPDCRDCQA